MKVCASCGMLVSFGWDPKDAIDPVAHRRLGCQEVIEKPSGWFTQQVDAHAEHLKHLPRKAQRRAAVRHALGFDTSPILPITAPKS